MSTDSRCDFSASSGSKYYLRGTHNLEQGIVDFSQLCKICHVCNGDMENVTRVILFIVQKCSKTGTEASQVQKTRKQD